jgi:hypothetical protein
MKTNNAVVLVTAGLLLAGCSSIGRMWAGGPRELPRIRDGSVEYVCDARRTLVVRAEAPSTAWLVYPDREVRLDSVAAGRYSNGRSTLTLSGDQVSLEEGGSMTHANCKRAAGP